MKLERITAWLDKTLKVADFDDVSNNGLQVEREQGTGNREQVRTVAFAVDASVKAVAAAAKAGAQLLVVHHGISWGGGVRRVSGGVGNVIRAALKHNLAICAYHLPLDAHPVLGNNAQLAKLLGLKKIRPAFSYHGNVIGLIGEKSGYTVGVCSGGAGEFAEEAKNLGCDVYLTGEASWGDVIAAENCGMKMLCLGHYETEVFGVRALAQAMKKALKVKTLDLTDDLKATGRNVSCRCAKADWPT